MNKKIILSAILSLTVAISCLSAVAAEVVQETSERSNTIDASVTVFGNVVMIEGTTPDGDGGLNLSYVISSGEDVISVSQSVSEYDGTFSKVLTIDPVLYGEATEAVCRISGYDVNTIKTTIPLYPEENLTEVIPELKDVSSKEDYIAFVERFGTMLELTELLKYPDATYEYLDVPADLSDFNDLAAWTKDFRALSIRSVNLFDELNAASTSKKWGSVKELVTDTYSDIVSLDSKLAQGIDDEKALYTRMTGISYQTLDDIYTSYENACTDQKAAEKSVSSKPKSNGGGGGGGGFTYVPPVVEPVPPVVEEITLPEIEFTDLENYSWALQAIDALRERGVVHGDGSGNFMPDKQVTREEMLTMLTGAFRIEKSADATCDFTDVDKNSWYYTVVAQANSMGLVNGLPDGSFGVGQPVTRADMAVMAMRLVDILNKDITFVKPAVVFEDYYLIPDYAADMISTLQQAGVLNGDNLGRFNPGSSASRAEAAVMIYNLLQITEG